MHLQPCASGVRHPVSISLDERLRMSGANVSPIGRNHQAMQARQGAAIKKEDHMRRREFLFSLTAASFATAAPGIGALAQQAAATTPDMAEGLRQSGKIYVVVLVLATIFAGIIAFLIYLERRLSRLEQVERLVRPARPAPSSDRSWAG